MEPASVGLSQRTRVNLERLLRSCDALGGSLGNRASRRRFETYLSVLQRYWHTLDELHCSEAVLSEYRRKIERLAELIDDGKLQSGAGSGLALSQAHNNAGLTRAQANSELASRLTASSRVQHTARSQLMAAGAADGGDGAAATPMGGRSALGLSGGGGDDGGGGVEAEALDTTLETQRALQETLLNDLSQSVAEMRNRSMQARQAVRDDMSTIDVTSGLLDTNQATMDKNNDRLKSQLKSMTSSTCIVWLMLLLVCLLFVFTFLLMKTFSKRR